LSKTIEVKGLEKLQNVLKQAPEKIRIGFSKDISDIAYKILATAKGLIKSRSGWLRDSGYVVPNEMGPTVSYTVAFGASYAAAVHEGSRPHMIYPRAMGGVLRFEVGGQVVFTRYVHHPGTMRQNYLLAAKVQHEGELLRIVKQHIAEWLEWSKS